MRRENKEKERERKILREKKEHLPRVGPRVAAVENLVSEDVWRCNTLGDSEKEREREREREQLIISEARCR